MNTHLIQNLQNLAARLDNTLLQPFAPSEQVEFFCRQSLSYPFASLCLHPCHLVRAARILSGSGIPLGTVIGFPLGANTTQTKLKELSYAIEDGAEELDVVINIGWLKSRAYISLEKEIRAIVQLAAGRVVKLIIETCYLTYEEKLEICKIGIDCGVDFLKTSTGFGTGGATPEDICLLKEFSGGRCKIKASGGIGTLGRVFEFLELGADRIGTSKGLNIIEEFQATRSGEI